MAHCTSENVYKDGCTVNCTACTEKNMCYTLHSTNHRHLSRNTQWFVLYSTQLNKLNIHYNCEYYFENFECNCKKALIQRATVSQNTEALSIKSSFQEMHYLLKHKMLQFVFKCFFTQPLHVSVPLDHLHGAHIRTLLKLQFL
jgi:hypothetical protein